MSKEKKLKDKNEDFIIIEILDFSHFLPSPLTNTNKNKKS